MKEKFTKPTLEVIPFDAEDIIVTSGGCKGDCIRVCPTNCYQVCSPECQHVT